MYIVYGYIALIADVWTWLYVGKSNGYEHRWAVHRNHSQFCSDYPDGHFEKIVVDLDEISVKSAEMFFIKELKTHVDFGGYNKTYHSGGGYKWTEEQKKELSEKHKERLRLNPDSDETRARKSASAKEWYKNNTKHYSDEFRQKMSVHMKNRNAEKGNPFTRPEVRKKISDTKRKKYGKSMGVPTGWKHTPEARAKMSKNNAMKNPKHRQALSERNRGITEDQYRFDW